jgi:hypothetical protein
LTVCDPVVAEMHAKALPLTGDERLKAYQAAVAKRCRHCARSAVIIEAFSSGHPSAGGDASSWRIVGRIPSEKRDAGTRFAVAP